MLAFSIQKLRIKGNKAFHMSLWYVNFLLSAVNALHYVFQLSVSNRQQSRCHKSLLTLQAKLLECLLQSEIEVSLFSQILHESISIKQLQWSSQFAIISFSIQILFNDQQQNTIKSPSSFIDLFIKCQQQLMLDYKRLNQQDLQPVDLPYHNKPFVFLYKYRLNFKQYIQKRIILYKKSDYVALQHILMKLKIYQKEFQRKESQLNLQRLMIDVKESPKFRQYRIIRPFIKSHTLKEYLNGSKMKLQMSKETLCQLISTYFYTINLNHTIFSLNNIFVASSCKGKIKYEFNYTSIAFIFDIYTKKSICKSDLIEYANYLPSSLFTHQTIDQQFNFYLKLRSLAINLLSIVLQRQISFFKKYKVASEYTWEECQRISLQNMQYFTNLLNHSKTKQKINYASKLLGTIDLFHFIKTVILEQAQIVNYSSWTKIINVFKLQFLHYYQNFFQLQFQIEQRAISQNQKQKRSYLLVWLAKTWSGQSDYVKKKFKVLGIVQKQSKQQLLLYLLSKYSIFSFPTYSLAQNNHHPQFIKQILLIYYQIIESDCIHGQQNNDNLSHFALKKRQLLGLVVIRLNEYLTQLRYKQNLFITRQRIDLRQFNQSCWHSTNLQQFIS